MSNNFRPMISIIVPCYNEEKNIVKFYDEVNEVIRKNNVLSSLLFEFLFIDDGSKDNTLNILQNLSKDYDNVKYVSFSRNFGKEAGLYAGLKNSTGEYIVVMDVDLQDPPSLLPVMYSYLLSGDYDCVGTRRNNREGEPVLRSFFSNIFYKLYNRISTVKLIEGARDYRMMTRLMVDSILDLPEHNRFSKGIFTWIGFRTKWLEYENIERTDGVSNWSFWDLFLYSKEGITGFTTLPLSIATVIGLIFSLIAFTAMLVIIIRTLVYNNSAAGWPSLTSIILFLSGVQLSCIGILGEYLAKVFVETKNRPIYVAKEKVLKNEEKNILKNE